MPCGFTPVISSIKSKDTITIDTLIGYTKNVEVVFDKLDVLSVPNYFENKELEAKEVIDVLLDEVKTVTNVPLFDEYIRQNYLDNLLRGGYPMTIPTKDKNYVYYLYSRKHGDLERDYNFFTIAPEFYSQGNGNFRDVCQNRRSDILLHPEIGDYNFHVFASLIQADGYNPLSINGSTFELKSKEDATTLIKECFNSDDLELVEHLSGKFTPGSIINLAYNLGINSHLTDEVLLETILSKSTQNIESSFGEGYWSDHWTYILDLVENYEHVFPDKMNSVLFEEFKYAYFLSGVSVYPRSEKTVVDKEGKVRQYGSLRHPDEVIVSSYGINPHGTNWLTTKEKEIIYTNLYSKLFVLAVNKFALLDAHGMGVEMEGNKPGWNDAMNGLPGLFGSGMPETIELKRLVDYLTLHLEDNANLSLLNSFKSFYTAIEGVSANSEFDYWDQVKTLLETYRESLRTPSSDIVIVKADEVRNLLVKMQDKLQQAIDKALILGEGIMPTYFTYEADSFEYVLDASGNKVNSHYGLPKAKVHSFSVKPLPYFLEGPARLLKVRKDRAANKEMIEHIKKTDLYDEVLGMYKTSSDLDAWGYEIGRIRAFTKGWLERESNFLHMTYKYLLGILKSGNVDEFFEESIKNLVYNLDPEKYGRSTLENSSFIATSNNPNPHIFSQGFVSRLSGSTAEMLSIWAVLVYGKELYHLENNELALTLKPLLSKEFFKNGVIETVFQGVPVVYQNRSGKDGLDLTVTKYTLSLLDGSNIEVHGKSLVGQDALLVRNKQVNKIIIELN